MALCLYGRFLALKGDRALPTANPKILDFHAESRYNKIQVFGCQFSADRLD